MRRAEVRCNEGAVGEMSITLSIPDLGTTSKGPETHPQTSNRCFSPVLHRFLQVNPQNFLFNISHTEVIN